MFQCNFTPNLTNPKIFHICVLHEQEKEEASTGMGMERAPLLSRNLLETLACVIALEGATMGRAELLKVSQGPTRTR